ncbi:ABC transporter permease [Chryseosolibacter indicus]|uniref:ABC transporter permease n=1 Tax=Chryseosolibacter indicus TaxID=2782351 RepID=A0ABS5VX12_9BACT|nr:ABC transporter permease [Chryseosolibacter indicus]MBT1705776.1 ABC transporter permease [Chryseosolibacter indicus]
MSNEIKPPKLADRIFLWYCKSASIEDIHGDVEELFYEDVKRHNLFKAKLNYWRRVVSLIFSYAIVKRKRNAAYHHFSYSQFNPAMFKNYFKTAIRNLSKTKFFTTINVFGLAVGMSLSLLFVAMVVFVYQFDNFHPNGERIYRVITHVQDRNENPSFASAPIGTAQLLNNNFSGVEKVVRIHGSLNHHVGYGENKIPIKGYFADADYLSIFNFPLLQGNSVTALAKPNTMVITEAAATKIFGSKNPIGELAFIEPFGEVMITGVAKNIPKNSHMKFEALVSFSTLTSHYGASFTDDEKKWNNFFNSYTYLLLAPNASPTPIEDFLNRIAKEKYKTDEFRATFELQRLDKIVPGPELSNNIGHGWSYESMVLNGLLPFIILLAACTNYVSLAISQALKRMKEIGVRKVMGGHKRQIFMQFVLESTIIMLLALSLSYFFFELIRDEALAISGETDLVDLDPTLGTYAGFIAFAVLVGFVSGIVPALHFAKITPITALKGKELQTKKGSRFSIRRFVITMQFILSLGFIMAVVIMVQQYRYSVNYDLGFDQENMLNVELQKADAQLVKNEFEKLSFVQTVSMSSHALGAGEAPGLYVRQTEKSDSIEASKMSVDENFIANMGLTLLHGRNFSNDSTQNVRFIIINEVFAKKLSPDDVYGALGQPIILPDKREVRVAGIVKDFHYSNLTSPIGNFFFEYKPGDFVYANLQLESTHISQTFSEMEAAWKVVGEGDKFKAQFLTDQIRDAYGFYFMIVKIWGFLGLLAIVVACLGLLGTVVFAIKNRVKEVSIRKVMGASSESLVYMLSKDFIILMVIASIITVPTVYFFMNWLLLTAQYYNVPIGAVEIIISLSIMLLLGMTTILSQTLKAANTNPVDNLRVE